MRNVEDQTGNPTTPSPTLSGEVIPTGSLRLDIALGIGGLARGQFVEILGAESSGKTTLCQHIVAEAQKLGGLCTFIDVDHTLEPAYAARCGVDPKKLYISQPEHAEQALSILETMARAGEMAVIVLDSVTALTPRGELHVSFGKKIRDRSQDLLSHNLRRISNFVRKSRTTIIFTSRAQQKVSAAYHDLAANPSRLALKLQAGQRLALSTADLIHKGGAVIGAQVEVRVIKNKFAPCLRATRFDIMYNNGIVKAGEIFDLGVHSGILDYQGCVCSFRGKQLGAGREEVIHFLSRDAHLSTTIEQAIRQKMLPTASSTPTEDAGTCEDDCVES